jgi:hypothetical protein
MKTNKEIAYEFFDNMRNRQVVAIKEIAKRNPESFKQYLMDYIDDGGDITISSDWKKFIRNTRF